MKDVMKIRIVVLMLVLTMGSIAQGQAIPAGSTAMTSGSSGGLNLPTPDGVLHYALSASEVIQYGYYGSGEVTHSTVLSGDIAYTAKSTTRPFNALVTGGVVLGNQSGQGTTYYSSVAVSQGYVTRHWVFNISDSFSFLPQSPTTGLSGIAGVGDLGAIPVPGPGQGPAGGIFSNAGNRVANSLSGSVERQISRDTSISGVGSWSVLNFLDDSANNGGLDSSQVSGTVAVNRRLDGRTSVSVNAVYSTINYSGSGAGPSEPDIETRGVNLSFQRLMSRTLSVSVSAGPQWISSSNSTIVPSRLNAAATAAVSYVRGSTSASVGYSHGVNAGSGVLPGALSDGIYGSLGHTYGRNWVLSFNGAYTHSSGLTQLTNSSSSVPANATYDTVFGGTQLTRRIGTHFSGYVSYSGQNQSSNSAFTSQNALNGTSQTFGIGITFTPRSTRLGQF
jgi:hypothetical protein